MTGAVATGSRDGRGASAATPTRRAAVAAFAVQAALQIAIPLVEDDRTLTLGVIVAFTTATALFAVEAWGAARAGAALAVVAVGTLALERVGSTTGFPFGEYDYTDLLAPQVGGVPVIVPLAWFAMGVPALAVGRSLAGRVAGPGPQRLLGVVLGAVALTAWDVFLDPQMVGEGYWVWEADGAWRGIPLSNYAGWLGSSLVVLGVVDRLLPTRSPEPLRWLYLWWAVMSTLGFLLFFGDAVVAVVGGALMVPLAVAALDPSEVRAAAAALRRRVPARG